MAGLVPQSGNTSLRNGQRGLSTVFAGVERSAWVELEGADNAGRDRCFPPALSFSRPHLGSRESEDCHDRALQGHGWDTMWILFHRSTCSRSFPFSCRGRSGSSRKDAAGFPASSRRRIDISCKNANTARRIAHMFEPRCSLHCPDIPEDRFHVMAQAGCILVPYRPELGD